MTETITPTHETALYATARLYTDTITFDVLDSTAKTVTVRRRVSTGKGTPDMRCDEGAYGIRPMIFETESVPSGERKVYRMRKDGTFRLGNSYGVFRFSDTPPTEWVDYRL